MDSGQNSSVYQCMPSLEALKIFDSLLESKGTSGDAACILIRLEDEGDVLDLQKQMCKQFIQLTDYIIDSGFLFFPSGLVNL